MFLLTKHTHTYWHTWQVTSDCRPPVKIWSMMQLQWFGLLAFFPLSSGGTETQGCNRNIFRCWKPSHITSQTPTQLVGWLKQQGVCFSCTVHLCSVCAARPAPQWGTHGRPAARSRLGVGRGSTPGAGGGTGCEGSGGLSRTGEEEESSQLSPSWSTRMGTKTEQSPPGRVGTSHTRGTSCSASRICVGRRGRSPAAAECASAPGRCNSWSKCCPGWSDHAGLEVNGIRQHY